MYIIFSLHATYLLHGFFRFGTQLTSQGCHLIFHVAQRSDKERSYECTESRNLSYTWRRWYKWSSCMHGINRQNFYISNVRLQPNEPRLHRTSRTDVISTPTRPPSVPAMVHCVYLSNGCLYTSEPGAVRVKPRKEYIVTPVMKAATAQARNTSGSDMTMLRR